MRQSTTVANMERLKEIGALVLAGAFLILFFIGLPVGLALLDTLACQP